MKAAANAKWDRLAGAAIASREAWRRIISMISEALTKGDGVHVLHEIREIAVGENGPAQLRPEETGAVMTKQQASFDPQNVAASKIILADPTYSPDSLAAQWARQVIEKAEQRERAA